MIGSRSAYAIALALLASSAYLPSAQADGTAGFTSAVTADALRAASAAPERVFTIRTNSFQNEQIATEADGHAQLLFEDGSTVTLAPSGDLVLDSFVYDSSAKKGKLDITLAAGTLRFVGGQLSKTGSVRIETANATIAIRGGIAIVSPEQVILLFGDALTVTAKDGSSTQITRPSYAVQTLPGQPISAPAPTDPKLLQSQFATFEGKPGAGAGPANPPADGGLQGGLRDLAGGQPTNPPLFGPRRDEPGHDRDEGQTIQRPVLAALYQPSPPPPPPRTAETWYGYAAGVGPIYGEANAQIFQSNDQLPSTGLATHGFTLVTDPATNTVRASLRMTVFVLETEDIFSDNLFFGGAGRSQYTDNYHFDLSNSIEAGRKSQFIDYQHALFMDAGRNPVPQTVIDDSSLFLISSDLVAAKFGLPQGFVDCDCKYVHWGAWGGVQTAPDVARTTFATNIFGTYAAGQLTAASDMPKSGSAEYVGPVVGEVYSGASRRLLSGTFKLSYNFANQAGQLDFFNFDDNSFTGTLLGGRDYLVYLRKPGQSSLFNPAITAQGSFFGPNAAETGGSFTYKENSAYRGAGIFVGKPATPGAASAPAGAILAQVWPAGTASPAKVASTLTATHNVK